MTSEQSTPTRVIPILANEGLQPILPNCTTPLLPKKVPVIFREAPKTILINQNLSSPPNLSSSPHTNTHTPPLANKRYIVLSDGEDTNRSKLPKLDELPSANIEDLKKQIEEEEAKLKLMLQLQSQKNVTTQSPQLTTITTPYLNSPPNKMSKPIIIHATNDGNKNSFKPTILLNHDNHSSEQAQNLMFTRFVELKLTLSETRGFRSMPSRSEIVPTGQTHNSALLLASRIPIRLSRHVQDSFF